MSEIRKVLTKQLRSLKARIAYLNRRNGNFYPGEYAKWLELQYQIGKKEQEILNLEKMGL